MINLLNLYLAAEEKPGGLFDFDGTVLVIGLQTVILSAVLKSILFNPLLEAIEERTKYVNSNLIKASEILKEAETILVEYETGVALARYQTENEIIEFKKLFVELFNFELEFNQYVLDNLVNKYTNDLYIEKERTISVLLDDLTSLSNLIYQKLGLR
jgi:F0F1-type ATP synthase membrane subunit b/b'